MSALSQRPGRILLQCTQCQARNRDKVRRTPKRPVSCVACLRSGRLHHHAPASPAGETMSTLTAIALEDTAFGTLASQHRLLNPVLKEPLPKAGTFGFRGDIALAFQEQLADEEIGRTHV